VAQFHWDPGGYLALMREEVPDYERLQDETVAATGTAATRVLELGTGTGETARRVLARHPAAILVGLDASREMLHEARTTLPADRVELHVARLEDPLPPGADQLSWLAAAGLRSAVAWAHRDLAVLVGRAPRAC
jgi:tRNA (cmo5U34)-methyltransferase